MIAKLGQRSSNHHRHSNCSNGEKHHTPVSRHSTKLPRVDEMLDRKLPPLPHQQLHMESLSEKDSTTIPTPKFGASPRKLGAAAPAASTPTSCGGGLGSSLAHLHLRRDDSDDCSSQASMDFADLSLFGAAASSSPDRGDSYSYSDRRARCRDAGALTMEASLDLAELCELAALPTADDGEQQQNDDGAAEHDVNGRLERSLSQSLSKLNARNHSSWADFSSSLDGVSGPLHRKGGGGSSSRALLGSGGGSDDVNNSRLNCAMSRNLSWLDLDDVLALDDDDDDRNDTANHDDEHQPPPPTTAAAATRRSTGVRFSRRPHSIHDHVALADLTPAEKTAYWYDENDHESIQLDIIRSLNSLQRAAKGGGRGGKQSGGGSAPNGTGNGTGEEVCLRGLEYAVVDGCWIDTHRKTNGNVVRAVMDEQARQRLQAAVVEEEDAHSSRRSRGGRGLRGSWRRLGSAPDGGTIAAAATEEEKIAEASRGLTRAAREMAAAVGRNDAAVVTARMAAAAGRGAPLRKVRTSAAA